MAARGVNWAKFRVSVVCLVGLAILTTLLYLLTGGTLLEEKATLYLYVPDATGLAPGLPVRVDGIGVGKIKTVRLSGSNDPARVVKVTMTLARNRLPSIALDSVAELASEGMAGDKYVAVTSGRDPHHIAPNGELKAKSQPDLVKTINLKQFEDQLKGIDSVLSDIEQGHGRVGEFVQSDNTYNDLRNRFAQLEEGMRAATTATTSVGQALYTDQLYQDIGAPFVAFDRTLALIQSGQGAAGKLLRDTAQYEQMRSAVADLRQSIKQLSAGELVNSDQAYADWNRMVAGWAQRVEEMNENPLFSSAQMFENLNGFAKQLRFSVGDFRQDPRKYLRIKLF